MPTFTYEQVSAYTWCEDPFCEGNEQRPVRATKERSDRSFAEWADGGVLPPVPGVENTQFRLMFIDPADAICPFCSKESPALSEQERPVYPNLVKAADPDQKFLLKLAKGNMVHAPGTPAANELAEKLAAEQASARDEEVAELRRTVAELTGTLSGFMAGQQSAAVPESKPRGSSRRSTTEED